MSNVEAYQQVWAKLNRANEHIQEFNTRWVAFRETNPYVIETKSNPQTGEVSYFVASVQPLPLHFATIAGDVFHNLRSALDHLAWKMVEASGQKPIEGVTAFPIFDSAAEYQAGAARKVKGMRQLAVQAINRIHPYNGGEFDLWRLHRLNNIDKHRLLLAVSLGDFGHRMTPSEHAQLFGAYELRHPNGAVPSNITSRGLMFKSQPRPLQAGDLLLTVPASEVERIWVSLLI